MAYVPDQVAIDIETFGGPVVPFCGWLSDVGENGLVRIYDRNTFDDFIEVDPDAIVAQLPGSSNPDRGQRSAVWVDATAAVRVVRTGTARYFFDTSTERDFSSNDPSGGYGGKGGSGRP